METQAARELIERVRRVRAATDALTAPLSPEDQTVQSMPDASPTKWRLAHTTWFWETFVLAPNIEGYRPVDDRFAFLFNSYYEAIGPRHERAARGVSPAPVSPRHAAAGLDPRAGRFQVPGRSAHPAAAPVRPGLKQMFGGVWEWTRSSYAPYPRYATPACVVGEYNGKFMCGQYVLRGGSCATPAGHVRATYRNFFPPQARWQFAGVRLAKDV